MRDPYNLTTVVMTDYADRIMYGQEAEDEALQNAIDWTFREYSDEFRANLYSLVAEKWDNIELRFVRLQQIIEQQVPARG